MAMVIRAIKWCIHCQAHTECTHDEKWLGEEWRCTECGHFI